MPHTSRYFFVVVEKAEARKRRENEDTDHDTNNNVTACSKKPDVRSMFMIRWHCSVFLCFFFVVTSQTDNGKLRATTAAAVIIGYRASSLTLRLANLFVTAVHYCPINNSYLLVYLVYCKNYPAGKLISFPKGEKKQKRRKNGTKANQSGGGKSESLSGSFSLEEIKTGWHRPSSTTTAVLLVRYTSSSEIKSTTCTYSKQCGRTEELGYPAQSVTTTVVVSSFEVVKIYICQAVRMLLGVALRDASRQAQHGSWAPRGRHL